MYIFVDISRGLGIWWHEFVAVVQHAATYCSTLQHTISDTGWRRPICCLIFIGHFPPKSPMIRCSFAANDLQLKASYGSLPPCTPMCLCVLLRTTAHCNTLQHTATHYIRCSDMRSSLECVAVRCSMLQYVTVCCSMLQYVAVCRCAPCRYIYVRGFVFVSVCDVVPLFVCMPVCDVVPVFLCMPVCVWECVYSVRACACVCVCICVTNKHRQSEKHRHTDIDTHIYVYARGAATISSRFSNERSHQHTHTNTNTHLRARTRTRTQTHVHTHTHTHSDIDSYKDISTNTKRTCTQV